MDDVELKIEGGEPVALISYTARQGTIAGIRLVEGRIREHSEHGTVVHFGWYQNAKTLKGKVKDRQDVMIIVGSKPELKALVALAAEKVAAARAGIAAEATALEPCGFVHEDGCDAADRNVLVWPEGSSAAAREVAAGRWPVAAVEEHLRVADFKAIAEQTGAGPIAPTMMTWGGYRFGAEGLAKVFALAAEREAAVVAKRDEEKRRREAKAEDAFSQAKATGKPVAIESWTEDCNDPREECNLDNCTRFAMPDGSTKVKRSHTW